MESKQLGTPEMAEELQSQRRRRSLGHQERSSSPRLVMEVGFDLAMAVVVMVMGLLMLMMTLMMMIVLLLLLLGLFGGREKGRKFLVLWGEVGLVLV